MGLAPTLMLCLLALAALSRTHRRCRPWSHPPLPLPLPHRLLSKTLMNPEFLSTLKAVVGPIFRSSSMVMSPSGLELATPDGDLLNKAEAISRINQWIQCIRRRAIYSMNTLVAVVRTYLNSLKIGKNFPKIKFKRRPWGSNPRPRG
uniref:Uncharacterized protein n=1 Tax=Oryza sativa subsp. japonica TaxID=39947 RepID=Q2QWL2_ORYSJ|nr:hypothetical protein LOC_Os12g08970 [Oryza sativa Japonica Group]